MDTGYKKLSLYKNVSTTVICANVVNRTLRISPLLIRLKIRQWLQTISFPRKDPSLEDGEKLRWIIVELLEHFRINGYHPWSRKPDGTFWDPEISIPFMTRMQKVEEAFTKMSDRERNTYIATFDWQF